MNQHEPHVITSLAAAHRVTRGQPDSDRVTKSLPAGHGGSIECDAGGAGSR